jgi:F-type H+-transporting ATPase subunit gamma
MATARVIKKRIRSTKNIKQITKAMQAVAAVKMRKSEEVALRARPYAYAALQILKNLTSGLGEHASHSVLLEKRMVKKTCLVVVTSDKGLAGSFNTNVLRVADTFIKKNSVETDIVAIGKKGRDHYARRGRKIVKEFLGIGDSATLVETRPVAELIKELFITRAYDEVHIAHTNFISALKQEVIVRKLLPFSRESLEEVVASIKPLQGKYSHTESQGNAVPVEYIFEPSPDTLLHKLLSSLLDVEVHHAILEANASEHSSRMVAMKNASENAGELIDSLTIVYNKSRQAQITKELTEITAGTEALASH